MSRRALSGVLAAVVAVVLLVLVGGTVRTPYVAFRPGPTVDVLAGAGGSVVAVPSRLASPGAGELRLVTVQVRDRPSVLGALRGWLRDDVQVVPRDVQFPPGTSRDEVREANEQLFDDSQQVAVSAAFTWLAAVEGRQSTAVVAGLVDGLPADGLLEVDDVVLAVNGEPVDDAGSLVEAVRAREPGDEVDLRVRRGGDVRDVVVATAESEDGGPVVGAQVRTGLADVALGDVEFIAGDIGGPSAGLAYALGLVDLLSEDVTVDVPLAVTGTISPTGEVGGIGGVRQKAYGAARDGAESFLVPVANCAEVLDDPPAGLGLYAVTDLSDAVDAVAALDRGRRPPTCADAVAAARGDAAGPAAG